jgi:hypothetical protein
MKRISYVWIKNHNVGTLFKQSLIIFSPDCFRVIEFVFRTYI